MPSSESQTFESNQTLVTQVAVSLTHLPCLGGQGYCPLPRGRRKSICRLLDLAGKHWQHAKAAGPTRKGNSNEVAFLHDGPYSGHQYLTGCNGSPLQSSKIPRNRFFQVARRLGGSFKPKPQDRSVGVWLFFWLTFLRTKTWSDPPMARQPRSRLVPGSHPRRHLSGTASRAGAAQSPEEFPPWVFVAIASC